MIELDTNVVVRYLVQDDPAQAAAATALIERTLSSDSPGLITGITLVAAQGGAKTVTFDRDAAKLPGFELLK